MNIDLSGKKVLLGVTGSISAYKACEVARLFVKSGASVRVVMSPSATRFVSALTFEALTRNPVLTTQSECWSSELNHIEYAKDADIFIIAPITANSTNKLSKGIADNILLETALAYGGRLLIAPAANTQMMKNHYTEGSLKMLRVNDIKIIEPQNKLLACGDTGVGALATPEEIYYQGCQALLEEEFWKDRKVVVTGGGTRESIDDVRYIGNHSSGKMGKALATALYLRGADVCYISTMPHDDLPDEIYTIDVDDAGEMLDYTVDAVRVAKKGKMSKASLNNPDAIGMIQKRPYLYMAAAVADFTPKYPQNGKLKKSMIGREWSIELKQTEDILKDVNKDNLVTIGFKAEMDEQNGLQNAKDSLHSKGVDAVCYNLLNSSKSFGTDDNEIIFLTHSEEVNISKNDKLAVSFEILEKSKILDGSK